MQDLRYALRTLGRSPAFTTVAVLTLALGIGANAAVFSVFDAVLLRPLPFPSPERLVVLWGMEAGSNSLRAPTSYPDFRDLQAGSARSFEALGAYRRTEVTVVAGGEPARVRGAMATRELFSALGASPALGRGFLPEEDAVGGPKAVILADGLWKGRFAGRADVLGQTLNVDGEDHEIVGVMPASFAFPSETALWVPAGNWARNVYRGVHGLTVVGRMRTSVSLSQAQDDVVAVAARLAREYPDDNAGRSARLEPLHEMLVGRVRRELVLLFGAVALVLLITCANVAGLLAARANGRTRELAIRASLGCTRRRIARQLLTESLVLALAGALVGLALATWAVPALVALAPANVPRLGEVAVDVRVFAFAFAVSLVATLLFGTLPALAFTPPDPAVALRQEGRTSSPGPRRGWIARGLAVAQTALAVVLLTGAGLLLKSLWLLARVDPGFTSSGALAVDVDLPEARYRDWSRSAAFYEALVERLRALPGVEAAGAGTADPFDPGWGARFSIEGRPPFPKGAEPEPAMRTITPGYLRAAGIRLLRGRELDGRDRAGAPGTVLVNEAFVRRFFPGEDPLGRRIERQWWIKTAPTSWEIVGVVADVRTGALEGAPAEAIYWPHAQIAFTGMSVLVRTAGDPLALAAPVREAVRELDRLVPLSQVRTLEQVVDESLGVRRFQVLLLAVFAGLALALAALGIYGVLASGVTQRITELGVRRALGAVARDLVTLIGGEATRLLGAGLLLGVAGALALARVMGSALYGVGPADSQVLAGVVVALAAVGALAAVAPLRRALAVDPAVALRGE